MKSDDSTIHYSAPDSVPIVIIVVDLFSDYESEETRMFYKPALRAARNIRNLRQRAVRADIPTIFVNDNYGRWRSNFSQLANRARRTERGRIIIDLLEPSNTDYFVLKPKHSIFFATPLNVLLRYLKARTLILTGSAGTQCILFSAVEAYIRDYELCVPMDCVVSENATENRIAKHIFGKKLHADTRAAKLLDLSSLKHHATQNS